MIGKKLVRRTGDFFNKVKSFAGSAYYHGKSIAQAVDQSADIVRRVHGALEPALKKFPIWPSGLAGDQIWLG